MRAWAPAGPLAGTGREDTAGSDVARGVLKRLAVAHLVAHTLGAIDVFLLLWLVLPSPRGVNFQEPTIVVANVVAFAVFLPLTLVIGTVWGMGYGRPWRRFLNEGRDATEEERVAALRHPLRSAKAGGILWGIAALLFAAVNLRFSGELA